MKTILIYKDHGQWFESPAFLEDWIRDYIPKKGFRVKFTDATSIKVLNVLECESVVALFMPGAHSRGYAGKLNGKGNKKIKEFVQKGGLYFGFCGGAYYASKKTIFKGEDLKIETENELSLFPGIAEGSVPELTGGTYFNDTIFSATAAKIKTKTGLTTTAYYNGGSFFDINGNEDVEVIASYQKINKPCVVKQLCGKGKAILSGVHPEYTSSKLKSLYYSSKREKLEKVNKILEDLYVNEKNGNAKAFAELILEDLVK